MAAVERERAQRVALEGPRLGPVEQVADPGHGQREDQFPQAVHEHPVATRLTMRGVVEDVLQVGLGDPARCHRSCSGRAAGDGHLDHPVQRCGAIAEVRLMTEPLTQVPRARARRRQRTVLEHHRCAPNRFASHRTCRPVGRNPPPSPPTVRPGQRRAGGGGPAEVSWSSSGGSGTRQARSSSSAAATRASAADQAADRPGAGWRRRRVSRPRSDSAHAATPPYAPAKIAPASDDALASTANRATKQRVQRAGPGPLLDPRLGVAGRDPLDHGQRRPGSAPASQVTSGIIAEEAGHDRPRPAPRSAARRGSGWWPSSDGVRRSGSPGLGSPGLGSPGLGSPARGWPGPGAPEAAPGESSGPVLIGSPSLPSPGQATGPGSARSGRGHEAGQVVRAPAPAATRSTTRPWPGSSAYGWMSSHGRSTKARRCGPRVRQRQLGVVADHTARRRRSRPRSRRRRACAVRTGASGSRTRPAACSSAAARSSQRRGRRPSSATRTTALRYAGWSGSPHGGVS